MISADPAGSYNSAVQTQDSGLPSSSDAIGLALLEYQRCPGDQYYVLVEQGEEGPPQPTAAFFDVPPTTAIEAAVLDACRGAVLDIGGGAGRASLVLQERGLAPLAVDVSPGAVEVMRARGVHRVMCADWRDVARQFPDTFDTIMLFGNGLGLAGDPDGLRAMLADIAPALAPGGHLVGDFSSPSSEDGVPPPLQQRQLVVRYGSVESPLLTHLLMNLEVFRTLAESAGWQVRLLAEEDGSYAVSLTPPGR